MPGFSWAGAKVVNKSPTQTLQPPLNLPREGRLLKALPPGEGLGGAVDLEGASLGFLQKIPTFAATLVHWFI